LSVAIGSAVSRFFTTFFSIIQQTVQKPIKNFLTNPNQLSVTPFISFYFISFSDII